MFLFKNNLLSLGNLVYNNLFSLVYYVGIEIIVFFLTALSIGNRTTPWNLAISIPILIATPFLFILAGRYALKTLGSSIKDLVSVLLVFIIGLLLTPGLAFLNTHNVHLSGNELYFLYTVPLDATIEVFNNHWSSRDLLMVGKGLSGLLALGLCSFIPTLLMWLGLRWRSRKYPSL